MRSLLRESFSIDHADCEGDILLEEYLLLHSSMLFSKKAIRKVVKQRGILVQGKPVSRSYVIRPGDQVEVRKKESPPGPPFELPLRILYEDSHCAVVEKPPGFCVNGNLFKTVENALAFNLEPSKEKGALMKPRPVHRLDKPTGGLLLAAKTSSAMINLSRQFQRGEVYKAYEALVCGDPGGEGRVESPIDGRSASTEYFALRQVPSLKNGHLTWLRLFPKSGRMHQLRRHCAELATPIHGDTLYGEEGRVLRGKGLFLWSVLIAFRHPYEGHHIVIKITPPGKFTTMMEREERRYKKYN